MERPFSPRSSSLPPSRQTLPHQRWWVHPLSSPTTPTVSSTPTPSAPRLLSIDASIRERIYTHLLTPTKTNAERLLPYSKHTFPTAALRVCHQLAVEAKPFITRNNTFNIVINGAGPCPGYLFSPTGTSPIEPAVAWITGLTLHLHIDLSSIFLTPPQSKANKGQQRGGNGQHLITALKTLVSTITDTGIPSLKTIDLLIIEVIPAILRIHPTCTIDERGVRARYAAILKPLFRGLDRRIVVKLVGVDGVYVSGLPGQEEDMTGDEGEGGEVGGEDDKAEVEESPHEGRRGLDQPREVAEEKEGWPRADDYEYLLLETLKELGTGDGRPRFVDSRSEEAVVGVGYGAREVFAGMQRRSGPLGGDEEEDEELEGEDEEELEEQATPSKGKRRGMTRLFSESRLVLGLSSGEKGAGREVGKEQKEREKLEREREKQRAKARKEQEKLERKMEKSKDEGSKDEEGKERSEGLMSKIKGFSPKKDRDGQEHEHGASA